MYKRKDGKKLTSVFVQHFETRFLQSEDTLEVAKRILAFGSIYDFGLFNCLEHSADRIAHVVVYALALHHKYLQAN